MLSMQTRLPRYSHDCCCSCCSSRLRVGVTYVDPVSNEPKSIRKFYRFAVQNPLVISFKQSNLKLQLPQHQTFVEAQIRNVSKLALFVDSIKFLPLPPFAVEEFEAAGKQQQPAVTADPSPQSAAELLKAGPQSLLNPQEELQRVFRITYDPTADATTVSSLVCVSSPGRWLMWTT